MLVPDGLSAEIARHLAPYKGKSIQNIKGLIRSIRRVEGLGAEVVIYPDAEEYINQKLFQERMTETVADIRKDPQKHPLRKTLLNAELLPYQMDGIAFCRRGRPGGSGR